MKKFLLFLTLTITTCSLVFSQEEEKQEKSKDFNHVSVAIVGGLGHNINGYRTSTDAHGFTYSGETPNYSCGLELGLFAAKNFRIRLYGGYNNMRYSMNWNDNYPTYDNTVTHLSYIDVNLNLDFGLYSGEKLSVFVSPGLTSEYFIDELFKTTLADGSISQKNYNVLEQEYPTETMYGANLSFIARYKLIDHLYVSLTPSYTLFMFNKFSQANHEPYQRLGINLGIEYNFW